jgi:hypothetical protein
MKAVERDIFHVAGHGGKSPGGPATTDVNALSTQRAIRRIMQTVEKS